MQYFSGSTQYIGKDTIQWGTKLRFFRVLVCLLGDLLKQQQV